MKVLWVCNIMIPYVAECRNEPARPIGGWLTGLWNGLKDNGNLDISVCFPYKKLVAGKAGTLRYYGFTSKRSDLMSILKQAKPELIHIFGTEYKHSYEMALAAERCGMLNRVLVSIQGLTSVYAKHYFAGVPRRYVDLWTVRDILRHENIRKAQKRFRLSGEKEICTLKKVKNISGRTDWDEACVRRINPDAAYHACNEILRPSFYMPEHRWKLQACERYSIFLSQSSYPIKGFHFALSALADVLKDYPDAHLYTTGRNPVERSLTGILRRNSYEVYIGSLIRKYGLENKVTFLGVLDEKAMCARFSKSHVFVSASSIENSPNSLGEAMILGVPGISSDVGGIKNMLRHGEEGFIYPYDEPYMLAYYIKKIFDDDLLAESLSAAGREHALITHSVTDNALQMMSIYGRVLNQSC